MSDFKVGDKVRCIRGVEGSGSTMEHEPLKTGEHYTISKVKVDHITVEGIGLDYLKDRFVKDET